MNTFTPAITELSKDISEKPREEIIVWFRESLPKYQEGTPEDPGEGYTEFETLEFPETLSDIYPPKERKIIKTKYRKEVYNEEEAYIGEEFQTVYTRNFESIDIFWVDRTILFRGSKAIASETKNKLQTKFINQLRIESVKLDPGIYQRLQKSPFKSAQDIKLEETRSASFKGAEEVSQIRLYGRNSSEIYDRYRPEHGRTSYIMGYFDFHGYRILSDISEDTVHVRTIESPQGSVSDREELIVIVAFLSRIVEINQLNNELNR